jgi:hypothetical protein
LPITGASSNIGTSKIVSNIAVDDVTWIYGLEPESKKQLVQWFFGTDFYPVKANQYIRRRLIFSLSKSVAIAVALDNLWTFNAQDHSDDSISTTTVLLLRNKGIMFWKTPA